MNEHISIGEDGRVEVQAGHFTEIVQAFTKTYQGGNRTGLQLIMAALMAGIQIGYDAKDGTG